ncbi:MAG: ATP-grasp domain-containing protein [Spirochaetia bacterium]|nr:ATP-grasp domain-containing protein [Spirochaetia bacterium]
MTEEKYVLILGAGLMQRPSIEAAWELGYKTLAVDANPKALCAGFADKFEQIDLKDKEKIADFALSIKEKIAAVFTAGTDFSTSVSYVAQKLGLPSHCYEAAEKASNKILMRKCFKQAGVPSPEFQQISRSQIAGFLEFNVLDSMTFPKVVKPVDNMGARGCRLIRSKKEFLPAIEDAVRYSRTGCAILEDFMEGPEYSIDALVHNGTLTITGFADRHIFFQPYFIELGHTMPSSADEKIKLELIEAFAKGVKALGLTEGAAKADIKYTSKGPMIGEIAARLSGGYMSGWTYPYASNLNLTKQALLIALGKSPEQLMNHRVPLPVKNVSLEVYDYPCRSTCAERAWISIPGVVKSVTGGANAYGFPFVKNVIYRSSKGDQVDFPRNNVEKCGNVISQSQQRELAVKAAQKGIARMIVRLEPDNPKTQSYIQRQEEKSEQGFPFSAYEFSQELKDAVSSFASEKKKFNTKEKLSLIMPEQLKNLLLTPVDFNCRSAFFSVELFEEYVELEVELDTLEFFNVLERAGLQGILYIADTKALNGKS